MFRNTARWACVPLAAAIALTLTGCTEPPQVQSAQLSLDGTRIALSFATCNKIDAVEVEETADTVTVTPNGAHSRFETMRLDCLDGAIAQLEEPLGDRTLFNSATNTAVPVMPSLSRDEIAWPYDMDRFTVEQYEEALDEFLTCVEAEDPEVEAWVTQDLNAKFWDFHKEPDATGNVEVPALAVCDERFLAPLR